MWPQTIFFATPELSSEIEFTERSLHYRLVGKPGDTLYFYGGLIYGIDKDGNDISLELQQLSDKGIEYIPFIRFEGTKPTSQFSTKFLLNQMGESVAEIAQSSTGRREGTLLKTNLIEASSELSDYYDLWGFKNFAFARLVTPSHLDSLEKSYIDNPTSYPLFLELHHSPSLKGASSYPVQKSVSYVPLSKAHCSKLFNHLYTARFIIKNGKVLRYGSSTGQSSVTVTGIPNGTYEFYHGATYQIYPASITKKLPRNHPIYSYSLERLITFYNLGIEWNSLYSPTNKTDHIFPSRYAYYRGRDLYLLGYPILKSTDSELKLFEDMNLSSI